jgi:catechol 2,3-dioxygenase-like lactoylglutathione lyase family enzyme
MDKRVDLVTLGVPDLEAARRFYLDGLGWEPAYDVPGEIVFIQVGHGILLALFGAEALELDAGGSSSSPKAEVPPPMSLAQIVETEDEVRETLDRARAAGATILKHPQRGDFGGFHGYFADPAGFRWEIATNPGWSVGSDGKVTIGPIPDG